MAAALVIPAIGIVQAGEGTWTPVGGPYGGPVGALAVAPDGSGTAYALLGSWSLYRGNAVYRTQDGGEHWQAVTPPVGSDSGGGVDSLAVDAAGHVYASGAFGISKSSDGGLTWEDASNGLDMAGCSRLSVFATGLYCWTGSSLGSYTSVDQGVSWQRLAEPPAERVGDLETRPLGIVALEAANPDRLYAVTDTFRWRITENGGEEDWKVGSSVLTSADHGKTWSRAYDLGGKGVVATVIADPTQSGTVYLTGTRGIIQGLRYFGKTGFTYRSQDGGEHWRRFGPPALARHDRFLAFSPSLPDTVYMGSFRGRLYQTADGGRHWKKRRSPCEEQYNQWQPCGVAVDPANPEKVYGWSSDGISLSNDGGASWKKPAAGIPNTAILQVVSPGSGSPIRYATTFRNGLFKSLDRGANWAPMASGVTPYQTGFVTLTPASGNGEIVYSTVGGKVVLRSADGGQNWKTVYGDKARLPKHAVLVSSPVVRPIKGNLRNVAGLTVSPRNSDEIFLPINVNDFGGNLIGQPPKPVSMEVRASRDGGKSWKTVFRRADFSARGLVIDPDAPDTAYLLLHNRDGTAVEVHRTDDGGRNWALVGTRSGIPTAMAVQPGTGDVYLSLTDAGAISHDRGQTWTPAGFSDIQSFLFDRADPNQAYYLDSPGGLTDSLGTTVPEPPGNSGSFSFPRVLLDSAAGRQRLQTWRDGSLWEYEVPGN